MAAGIRGACWPAAALLLLANSGLAQPAKDPDPLFASHEPITMRLSGPFTTLRGERPDDADLPGTARWQEADGRTVEVDIGLRARGNYRRRKTTCSHPPLRLDFKTGDVQHTVFHKQNKLKLVGHCKPVRSYQQSVLREYVAYRMLNELTDLSYRVRLLDVTYMDTESDGREITAYAFAIESKQRLAKRTGLPVVEVPGAEISELDPAYTNLVSVFQYMIGNTDFSPVAGPEGEDCCHNVNLFGGGETALFPVPYDFDITGIVDAPYATPNPRFRLNSVRERLYRGRCVFNDQLPASLQTFRNSREALYALVENEALLSKSSKNSMRRFLDGFFKVIDKPKSLERRIIRACVGPA